VTGSSSSPSGSWRPLRPALLLALLLGLVVSGIWSMSLSDGTSFGSSAWAADDEDGDDGGDDGGDDAGDDDGDESDDGDTNGDEEGDEEGEDEGDEGEEGEEEEEEAAPPRYLLQRLFRRESGDPDSPRDTLLVADLAPADLALLESRGFRVRDARRLLGLDLSVTRLRPPPGMPAAEAMTELRRLLPGRTADRERSYRLQRAGCTEDACWPLGLVEWRRGLEGCRPRGPIGMIDTGVARDHPALRRAAIEVRHLAEGKRADPDHGTAIAALLVGDHGVGALPGARLLVADVFTRDEEGPLTGALEIVRGLDWLVRRQVSPINLSLAGPDNAVLRLAVERAVGKGFVLVAAAGNGGPRGAPAYPAAYPGVIAVTAVDRKLRPYVRANRGPYIAFAAPGVGLTAGDGSPPLSGTSYATPFVTAAAALLLADARRRSPAGLEAELALRARDLGPPGRDPVFGWGLVRLPRRCAS